MMTASMIPWILVAVALVFAFGYAIGYAVGEADGYGEAADVYGRKRREAVRK